MRIDFAIVAKRKFLKGRLLDWRGDVTLSIASSRPVAGVPIFSLSPSNSEQISPHTNPYGGDRFVKPSGKELVLIPRRETSYKIKPKVTLM